MTSFVRGCVFMMLLASCAHPSPADSGPAQSGDVITEAEIARSQSITAYDAVQKLRANFLSNRGTTTILGDTSPLPVVYLDGIEYGPMASLRNIPADHVSSIRMYRAWEATTKFGMNKTAGVIEVLTKNP
jgi:outer membrane cobalamin receptor